MTRYPEPICRLAMLREERERGVAFVLGCPDCEESIEILPGDEAGNVPWFLDAHKGCISRHAATEETAR